MKSIKDADTCRALVISDTHGRNPELIKKVIEREFPFDLLIHCGDVICDIYQLTGSNPPYQVYAVKGNCDIRKYPREVLIEAAGHRIFAVHGDAYGVYYSSTSLYAAAAERKADVVLFGHTHVPETGEHNGIFLLNPGSFHNPHGADRTPTYGLLELSRGEYPKMSIRRVGQGDVSL